MQDGWKVGQAILEFNRRLLFTVGRLGQTRILRVLNLHLGCWKILYTYKPARWLEGWAGYLSIRGRIITVGRLGLTCTVRRAAGGGALAVGCFWLDNRWPVSHGIRYSDLTVRSFCQFIRWKCGIGRCFRVAGDLLLAPFCLGRLLAAFCRPRGELHVEYAPRLRKYLDTCELARWLEVGQAIS